MTDAAWVAEAARVLNLFHRAGLLFGFVVLIAAAIKLRKQLSDLSPVGYLVSAMLSGYGFIQPFFALYWIIWQGRPISDISPVWLAIYVYAGAALIMLTSGIGMRAGFTGPKPPVAPDAPPPAPIAPAPAPDAKGNVF